MSIFPFIDASGVTDTKKVTDLPLLKEYAYDYAKNELLLDENGCTYLVEGNAALRIWIFKALTTARFRHVAYSPAFGEEYEDQLIGHSMNREIVKSEMKRYITEALMVNPYIKKLENFNFETSSWGMKVTFDCTSIYGKETVPIRMEGVNV